MDCNIPNTHKKRIVIVGGGFAGLELIQKLKDSDYQLVLVDKNNYHQFPPLLYQVATAGLEANSISFPFRKIFQRYADFYFRLAEVRSVDFENNRLITSIGEIGYDYLVLAAGAETNYYGNEQIKANGLPMKSLVEALNLRNTLLSNLEKVTLSTNEDEKQSLMNIVVGGGGPTGVEIAGALSEMKNYIIPKDYPELNPQKVSIYLIEGEDRVLAPMSKQASENAGKSLKKMGVNLILKKKVTGYDGEKVFIDDGTTIPSKTFIWVSGISAVQFKNIQKEMTGHGGRILVNEYNQLANFQNVFAIGDVCLQTEEKYPKGHPQLAQVAIQQGRHLGQNFKNIEQGKPMEAFHYKDLGSLATIGRNKAVADLRSVKLHGFPAWAIWAFVHIRSLLGVKNKLQVLLDWSWSYFTYDRSDRVILAVPPKENQHEEEISLPATIEDKSPSTDMATDINQSLKVRNPETISSTESLYH